MQNNQMFKKYGIRAFFIATGLISSVILIFANHEFFLAARAATKKTLSALLAQSAKEGTAKDEVLKLNDRVQEHKKKVQVISSKISEYQKKIESKRREQSSLVTQLSILDNRVDQTALEIEQTQEETESALLEIQALNLQIEDKQNRIEIQKKELAEGIRRIDREDSRNRLEMLLLNDSFSDFFEEIAMFQEVYASLGKTVKNLKNLQGELTARRENVDGKRQVLEKLKAKLDQSRESLLDAQRGKEILLQETRLTSQRFQNTVSELRGEQEQIDEELTRLESSLREKLKNSDLAISPDQVILSWPVDPGRGITAFFRDPDYPFRYIFEHPAIDIRAFQSTPVKAAAAGYVAKVKNGGARGYSYIMLVHGGGISTVYGHLSRLNVAQDTFVERGQVIALSGGAPGTPGAGPLTTGPHLHFETRLSGMPVDPLSYLIR